MARFRMLTKMYFDWNEDKPIPIWLRRYCVISLAKTMCHQTSLLVLRQWFCCPLFSVCCCFNCVAAGVVFWPRREITCLGGGGGGGGANTTGADQREVLSVNLLQVKFDFSS